MTKKETRDYEAELIREYEHWEYMKEYGGCTDPQKLDLKSNDWRSVFLWLNILLNLKRK